jgi:hypothetical protein
LKESVEKVMPVERQVILTLPALSGRQARPEIVADFLGN